MAKARPAQTVQVQDENFSLPYLSDIERFKIYQLLVSGNQHFWSKNKLEITKVLPVLTNAIKLAKEDPEFSAHLLSYVMKNSESRDLKVLFTYANFLNDADGTFFGASKKYRKPDYRSVAIAALLELDPKLAERVVDLRSVGVEVPNILRKAKHWPDRANTAVRKYLKYREAHLNIVKGIVKTGMSKVLRRLYIKSHLAPSTEVAELLRWKQKDGRTIEKKVLFDIKGLSATQIAKKIQTEKPSPQIVLGVIEKITPVIAAAILDVCTGNQALIYSKMFEEAGILNDKEVRKAYEEKVMTATSTADRAQNLSKDVSEETKAVMKQAKQAARKKVVEKSGLDEKVYLHVDVSSSMQSAITLAKRCASEIAECINDPAKNFVLGHFGTRAEVVKNPTEFTAEAFAALMYAWRANQGSTDIIASYELARQKGATVDIYLTDGGHNVGNFGTKLTNAISKHGKPNCAIVVNLGSEADALVKCFEKWGIPSILVDSNAVLQSALVAETIAKSIKGPMAVLEQISATPLLQVPAWYNQIEIVKNKNVKVIKKTKKTFKKEALQL